MSAEGRARGSVLIEETMYFALGFCVAGLALSCLFPVASRRGTRIAMRRIQSQLPLSLEEVAAERALLRAQCAVRERVSKQEVDAVKAAKAKVMADNGRYAARVIDLDQRLKTSETRAAGFETRLGEAGKLVDQLTFVLDSACSKLAALKSEKRELEEAFKTASTRLAAFESRHNGDADIESVTELALRRPARIGETPLANDNLTRQEESFDSLVGSRLLMTEDSSDWRKWVEEAALDVLPPSEAIAYLQSRARREDDAGARRLAEMVGRLPLTLDLAADYCKRTQMSFADYTAKVGTLMAVTPRSSAYPRSVAATFSLAIAEAAKQIPTADRLVSVIALCAPGRIPTSLLMGIGQSEAESKAALLAMEEMSLAKDDEFEDGTPAVSVHRLVQALARARTDVNRVSAVIERILGRLVEIYPQDAYHNPASWPLCAQLTPHLLATCETKAAQENCGVDCADLMVRTGNYFHGRGAYVCAEPLFRKALALREEELGPMHPETAAALNNLGALLCAQGDPIRARPMLERALMIFEKAFGRDYSQTGRYQMNYARLLLILNYPKKALALGEAALSTHEKTCGPNHSWTIDSARVTADALDALGRTAKANALRARYGIGSLTFPAKEPSGAALGRSFAKQFSLGLMKSRYFGPRSSIAKSN